MATEFPELPPLESEWVTHRHNGEFEDELNELYIAARNFVDAVEGERSIKYTFDRVVKQGEVSARQARVFRMWREFQAKNLDLANALARLRAKERNLGNGNRS
jgi:hypothetical protein